MGDDSGQSGGFDASKTGKIPENALHNAPKDLPAVYLAFVDPDIGYGIFAARDFEAGEYIFHEAPVIGPTNFCQFRQINDKAHGPDQFREVMTLMQNKYSSRFMQFAFPGVATEMGLLFPTYAQLQKSTVLQNMGFQLKHGRLVSGPGQQVTEEEYKQHVLKLYDVVLARGGRTADIDKRVKICADFFRGYAFQDFKGVPNRDPKATCKATIYILASLINHCCTPKQKLRKKSLDEASASGSGSSSVVSADNSDANLTGNNNDGGTGSGGDNAGDSINNTGNNNIGDNAGDNSSDNSNDTDNNTAGDNNHDNNNAADNNSNNSNPPSGHSSQPSQPSQPPGTSSTTSSRKHHPKGPNCEWRIGPGGLAKFIEPHHIVVQAKRPIKRGEELTWDYGKQHQTFTCLCSTCDSGPNRACCVL
ncbi:hypothetical protein B0T21DRAFT_58922 [Apiosordaria backusii]|uniref:SET domain-containing protein n=1 Tax=Apiosordaria backusii TaxID=314023 RepID=A0AA40AN67_9PEZI|nr:hypothetical protein B0T21DRAFT_58922 [Apiosordaria backusii]